MVVEIVFEPGAVTAGTNISIPNDAPPIGRILSAAIFRGSDATVAAAWVAGVSATKVDDRTITLNVDTTSRDVLVLRYIGKHEIPLK